MTVLSDEHDLMLTRNLFYTAETRAESIFVLIGSKQAANKAVANNRVRERKTSLSVRLVQIRRYIQLNKTAN
jgi:exodeoxyribonuclease V alpha subunit